ncbi:IS4-like transposase, partial [Calderihabitans maritimus]
MRKLERKRGKGRNDYPIRAVWNSIIAGIIYQHPSIESLRRELLRNAQL